MRNCVLLVALGIALSGCAISPDKISSTDSGTLCRVYGASLHPNFLDPNIKAELTQRGQAACTDYNAIMARDAQSSQMMMMGAQMMQQSQQRPYYAPPVNCYTRNVGGTYQTICQ